MAEHWAIASAETATRERMATTNNNKDGITETTKASEAKEATEAREVLRVAATLQEVLEVPLDLTAARCPLLVPPLVVMFLISLVATWEVWDLERPSEAALIEDETTDPIEAEEVVVEEAAVSRILIMPSSPDLRWCSHRSCHKNWRICREYLWEALPT